MVNPKVANDGRAPLLSGAPLFVVIGLLLIWPLLLLIEQSLREPAGSLTLAHYRDLLTVPRFRSALIWSVQLSAAVAAVSTLLCLAPAWLLARHEFAGKHLVRAVLTLPMAFAGMIVGFLIIILLGRSGFIPQVIEHFTGEAMLSGVAYTFPGLVLAYLYFEIPRATLTLESSFRKLDLRLEAAARSLGAGSWLRLRWIILPLLWPALLSTFAVTFSVSLGSFGVLLILSVRRFTLLPLEIFTQYVAPPTDHHLAAAMSVTLLIIALATNVGLRHLASRKDYLHG